MTRLVYLSPVPWASVAQRPHKFVTWFQAVHGGSVLWLDPYPARFPQWSDLRRGFDAAEPGSPPPPWLRVLAVPALPVEPLAAASAANRLLWLRVRATVRAHLDGGPSLLAIGKPSRLAAWLLDSLRPAASLYDGMDDFPAFHRGRAGAAMEAVERAIVARVQQVCASSSLLQAKFQALGRSDAALVRNACDPDALPALDEAARLREPDLVGYVGTLASWFDWPLVLQLARGAPALRFRFIGPRHGSLPASLPANVELRPPCAHPEAMREMARFAVGLIPFAQTPLTAAVDPVKYYEYRALGTAVLTTAFGEMLAHAREDAGVVTLDAARAPADALRQALDMPAQDARRARHMRDAHAWSRRFDDAAQQGLFAPGR